MSVHFPPNGVPSFPPEQDDENGNSPSLASSLSKRETSNTLPCEEDGKHVYTLPMLVLGTYTNRYRHEFETLNNIFKNQNSDSKGECFHFDEALKHMKDNRWRDILPYDENRISVNGGYINASPIRLGDEEYIATQAPLPHTVGAFWEMAWEQNSTAAVMLTKFVEKKAIKAILYWPSSPSISQQYGSLTVELCTQESVSLCDDATVTVRTFVLTKDEQKRDFTHFHFECWPDHGVISALLLNDLISKVQQAPHQGPLIVHCSSGIGRTGVFIAVKSLINGFNSLFVKEQCLPAFVRISVSSRVKEMRQQRMKMVQTEEQYLLIYEALQEHFKPFVSSRATI